MMKYMALIYTNRDNEPQYGTPEFFAYVGGYQKATQTYNADGVYVSGDALQHQNTATTVRVRDGKVETMDGPYAETKEQLGGYYIFDCENLDQAIKYAAIIPGAALGAVEVRPIIAQPLIVTGSQPE